jgi:hypothetical protein
MSNTEKTDLRAPDYLDEPGVIVALHRARAIARESAAYYTQEVIRLESELRRRGAIR